MSDRNPTLPETIIDQYPPSQGETGVEPKYSDSLTFDDAVIEKIAGIAAREISGILDMKGNFISGITENFSTGVNPTKGISAEINENDVIIDVKVILEYGASAPHIFEQLKKHIREQLETMTGLNLRELNVRVVDVMTRKEFDKESKMSAAQMQQSYQQQGYNTNQNHPF